MTGRGHGSAMLCAFVNGLFAQDRACALIDPDPIGSSSTRSAVRAKFNSQEYQISVSFGVKLGTERSFPAPVSMPMKIFLHRRSGYEFCSPAFPW
jgi:hypothetical protein